MAVIEKSVTVAATADAVFAILDDPARIPEFAPGVQSVDVVRRTDERVGDSFKAAYKTAGITFPTIYTTELSQKPSKIVERMEGALMGRFNWTLAADGESTTRVSVRIDYQMKGGLLGQAMDALMVRRMNEGNAEKMLENLKGLVERAPK